ncbi:MFS transporter cpaT [Paramyrothecium foliicola]|nr:MFS transporter cpaT [Paramyrothecium foliicola]
MKHSLLHAGQPRPLGYAKGMWNPVWLSLPVLALFTFLFVVMQLATVMLYHFSKEHHGLGTQDEKYYYAWKYGPTAVLVVVNALWRQVDHSNKILTPWKELSEGPAAAEKTLLLDYVSPILPVNLWMAMKYRHWAVVLSITGQILILASTVFSTALIVLEPTNITQNQPDLRLMTSLQPITDFDWYLDIGPWAAQIYHGVQFLDVPYPLGTSEDIALPQIHPPSDLDGIMGYSAIIDGFKADSSCEVLPVPTDKQNLEARPFKVDIDTFDCHVKDVEVIPSYEWNKDLAKTVDPKIFMTPVLCNETFSTVTEADFEIHAKNKTVDSRLLLSTIKFAKNNQNKQAYVEDLSMVLCRPSFSLRSFDVRFTSPSNWTVLATYSNHSSSVKTHLGGYSEQLLGFGIFRSAYEWSAIRANSLGFDVGPYGIPLLLQMKQGSGTSEPFLDPEILASTATDVFNGVAVQLLQGLYFQPKDRSVSGTVMIRADRLLVTKVSTILMSLSFGMSALISLAILVLRPHSVIPFHPEPLSSMAVILAGSPQLTSIVSGLRNSQRNDARARLAGFRFGSTLKGTLYLNLEAEPLPSKDEMSHQPTKHKGITWWQPVAGTDWFLALTVFLPLAVIGLLEGLQHVSDRDNGILELTSSQTAVFTTYIPAAVVLGFASMYACVERNIAILSPFVTMKRGKAPASRSINTVFTERLLPRVAYLSVKAGHLALTMVLLGSFIGGYLSIVTSGLYKVTEVPRKESVWLRQEDRFEFNNGAILHSDEDGLQRASLLEYNGLEYGRGAHQNLAFNRLHYSIVNHGSALSGSVNAEIPGIRAQLNCTAISLEEGQYNITADKGEDMVPIKIHARLPESDWCETHVDGSPSSTYPTKDLSGIMYVLVPTNGTKALYAGANELQWNSDGSSDTGREKERLKGCPTLIIGAGEIGAVKSKNGNNTSYTFQSDLGVVVCYQNLLKIQTNVTLTMPSLDIDLQHPPQTNESSTTLILNGRESKRFDYPLSPWLTSMVAPIQHGSSLMRADPRFIDHNIHPFFQVATQGEYRRPFGELLGAQNTDTLADTVDGMYSRYMAQAISLHMRDGFELDGPGPASYEGIATLPSSRRLKQNRETKIALQIMLSVMVACGLVARLLFPSRNLLLYDPCSIFGRAALLVGSDMVEELARAASEHQQAGVAGPNAAEVYQGQTFTLKWWQDGKESDDDKGRDSGAAAAATGGRSVDDVEKHQADNIEDAATTEKRRLGLPHMDPEHRAAVEKRMKRKLDARFLLFVIIYIMNYLDRNNIAAARLRGLEADLQLNDTQYATCLSILYVGYILMQVPSNMFINYISRPSLYISAAMLLWGLISTLSGNANTFGHMVAIRFFLGFVEAAFLPGALLILSKWYTRRELTKRNAILFCGNLISNAFSALIGAGVLSNMQGVLGHAAWRWLFWIEGAITMFIAILAAFILPDLPHNSRGFTEEELQVAQMRMVEDVGEADTDSKEQGAFEGLILAVKDVRIYLMLAAFTAYVTGLSFNAFFPTLTQTLGFSYVPTLLMSAPPWVFSVIFSLIWAWHADRTQEMYFHIAAPVAMGIVGFVISMSTLNVAARYVALFLQAGSYAGYIVFYSWISSSFPRPPAKRAVAIALINGFGQLGNVAGSYVWRLPENGFRKSYGIVLAMFSVTIILSWLFRMILVRMNKELESGGTAWETRRDVAEQTARLEDAENIDGMRKGFRRDHLDSNASKLLSELHHKPRPTMVAGAADENEPLLRSQLDRNNTDITVITARDDPQQFPDVFKWSIVGLMAFMAFSVTFNCIGIVPVANRVIEDLSGEHSKSASILLVTVWELGEAAGPLLIGPLSEAFGRYPVINIANVLFIFATVVAAISPSVPVLIIARALTGVAVTVNVLNPAIVGDMFRPDQRGSPMSLVQLAPLIGGASGPAISGAIAQTLGWRYVLWISAALATACELAFLTGYSETYKPAIARAKRRRMHREDPEGAAEDDDAKHEAADKLLDSIRRPAIVLASSGVLTALSLFGAVIFAHFYVMSVTLPSILEDIHGLSPAMTGLSMMAASVGAVSGVSVCNKGLDRVYIKLREANGGVDRPEYRLPFAIIGAVLLPIAVVSYGWITELRLPLPLLLLSVGVLGFSQMFCMLPLSTYVVDAFGSYSASALTAVIITRCLMGTFLPLTTTPLVDNLGWGWGFTVLAGATLCLAPIPVVVMKYGEQWRQRSEYSRI